jgi:hypothetical protein
MSCSVAAGSCRTSRCGISLDIGHISPEGTSAPTLACFRGEKWAPNMRRLLERLKARGQPTDVPPRDRKGVVLWACESKCLEFLKRACEDPTVVVNRTGLYGNPCLSQAIGAMITGDCGAALVVVARAGCASLLIRAGSIHSWIVRLVGSNDTIRGSGGTFS